MHQDIPHRALDWLAENRKLNRKSLARVERESAQNGRPIEQLLLEAGEIDRPAYLGAASEVTGVPPFNLLAQKISYTRAQMIPRQVADQIPALPVALEDGQLVVVMADPTDTFALERLSTLTHLPIAPRVTFNPDFPAAIEKAFAVKVERITAETPHHQETPSGARPGVKFATATRPKEVDARFRNAVVQNLHTSRSVKIDGFITPAPVLGETRVDSPEEKLEYLERNLIQLTEPSDSTRRLNTILISARTVCRADGASLLLLSEDRTELYFTQASGSRAEELMKIRLPLDEHSVAGFSVLQRQTIRVNDAVTDPRQSKETDAKIGYRTRSIIAAPVSWEGDPLGVLEVVNKRDGSFDDLDVEFMQVLAAQTAVAIVLSQMAEQARNFRKQTVSVLREALDQAGAQTRGHGELVARVAVALGQELKLSPQELERLDLAARLHDLGMLRGQDGHADRGADLLARIQALGDVAAVLRHHHAYFDGTGSPDGLAREAIPRLSRILALAEAWIEGLERSGLPRRNEVLHEILAGCGTRFDPALKIPFEIAVNAVTPPG